MVLNEVTILFYCYLIIHLDFHFMCITIPSVCIICRKFVSFFSIITLVACCCWAVNPKRSNFSNRCNSIIIQCSILQHYFVFFFWWYLFHRCHSFNTLDVIDGAYLSQIFSLPEMMWLTWLFLLLQDIYCYPIVYYLMFHCQLKQ